MVWLWLGFMPNGVPLLQHSGPSRISVWRASDFDTVNLGNPIQCAAHYLVVTVTNLYLYCYICRDGDGKNALGWIKAHGYIQGRQPSVPSVFRLPRDGMTFTVL